MNELDKLVKDVHASVRAVDRWMGNDCDWAIVRAELLRLSSELDLMRHIQASSATEAVGIIARAEKAEAELAALKARIAESQCVECLTAIYWKGQRTGATDTPVGKRVRLLVDEPPAERGGGLT